jgi:putative transposase
MPKSKLTDEQILTVIKQLEAGRRAADVAREVGVSTYTIHAWKAKYGGMDSSDAVRLRHREDENGRLKKLVAEVCLDREMLKVLATAAAGRNSGLPGSRVLGDHHTPERSGLPSAVRGVGPEGGW